MKRRRMGSMRSRFQKCQVPPITCHFSAPVRSQRHFTSPTLLVPIFKAFLSASCIHIRLTPTSFPPLIYPMSNSTVPNLERPLTPTSPTPTAVASYPEPLSPSPTTITYNMEESKENAKSLSSLVDSHEHKGLVCPVTKQTYGYCPAQKGDSRSPCPALNTMANHGYMCVFVFLIQAIQF